MDSQYGIAHSPIGPSPSQSPLAFRPFGSASSGPPSAYSSALARTASASNNSSMSTSVHAPTASTSGTANISRLSKSTSSGEVTAGSGEFTAGSDGVTAGSSGVTAGSGAVTAGSSGITGASSGALLEVQTVPGGIQQGDAEATAPAFDSSEAQQQALSAAGLTPLVEQHKGEEHAASIATDADSMPTSNQSAVQSDPSSATAAAAATANDAHLESKSTPHQATPPQSSTDQEADSSAFLTRVDQLSIQPDPEAVYQAAAEAAGPEATSEATAAPPDEAELRQSMDAMLSGEDQAMKESLAAANAAGGERVGEAAASTSSGLQQHSSSDVVSAHAPSPDIAATAPAASSSETDSEAAAAAPAASSDVERLQNSADAGPSGSVPLQEGGSSSQIAERYRQVRLGSCLCCCRAGGGVMSTALAGLPACNAVCMKVRRQSSHQHFQPRSLMIAQTHFDDRKHLTSAQRWFAPGPLPC